MKSKLLNNTQNNSYGNIKNGTTIPYVIEKSRDGERSYDIYSRLLRDRIIFIGDEIDDSLANSVIAQILFLEKESPNKDITMYIQSPGGGVYAGFSIIDVMDYVKCDIATVGLGICASFGALLLAAGTKGKRFILPNTTIMIHQPIITGGIGGQATEIDIEAKEILRQKAQINKILSEFTGQKLSQVEKDTDRNNWMNAEQCLKYGLVDKIISRKDLK